MVKAAPKKIGSAVKRNKLVRAIRSKPVIFMAIFAVIGLLTAYFTLAAVFTTSFEPENGNKAGVTVGNDNNASGGKYIQFGDAFTSTCLSRGNPTITLSGLRKSDYKNYSLPANAIVDATNLTWDGTDSAGDPIPWVIGVGGAGPSCWYGGKYTGVWDDTDPSVTWSDPYHHAGVMSIKGPNILVEGLRADNNGDGIIMDSQGSNFHVRAVYLSNMHDDCIENDSLLSGLVEDSLFDGCYTGISSDDFTASKDGSANTMTLRNNLMYIKPTNTVYRGPSPGTGLFFKGWWQSPSEKVVFNNNIVRIDSDSGFGSLAIPAGMNLTCSNNTIVWTGGGTFPYTYPSCFTITSNVSVWNNAVTAWKAAHPNIH